MLTRQPPYSDLEGVCIMSCFLYHLFLISSLLLSYFSFFNLLETGFYFTLHFLFFTPLNRKYSRFSFSWLLFSLNLDNWVNVYKCLFCLNRCKHYFGLAGVNLHLFLNIYLRMPGISSLNAYKLTQTIVQLQLSYFIILF